ncbi:MAG: sensor protein KdpD [Haliscomenobacter sp.]|uniref:sensor protein KdpD n=1 Tax=Haliscomenobacter sp. TaxID=2717303 RepID=UPI0029B8C4C8|nr:sensor protein KdpD [Haliscomenobacter sp.]MDX2072487.1 sensor protein KdpD [Haliscomenobacter sp.]
MQDERTQLADQYLAQLRKAGRGKLKIYIGMSAGVGKTYRMLQEARQMMDQGIQVVLGLVVTHGRKETEALLKDLPVLPPREVFYKGKKMTELDLNAILVLHPTWVVVDELAHSNIPGSKNPKRWQDVMELLAAGINVITAVNIQHIESINDEVFRITGVQVQERVPDDFLQKADEVVNIDLSAEDLITRLKEGKIYDPAKVEMALRNFFQPEKILQLRELALKEVATQVERKVEQEVPRSVKVRHERFLACISSNEATARKIIRKTARLARYYQSKWFVLYVQTPNESLDKIPLDKQRHLINNFQLAVELGAEVLQAQAANRLSRWLVPVAIPLKAINVAVPDIGKAILEVVKEKQITTICIGKPHLTFWQIVLHTGIFNQLLRALKENEVDVVILS